jgi:hypothetical protein
MVQEPKEGEGAESTGIKPWSVQRGGQTETGKQSMQGLAPEATQVRDQERLEAAASRINQIDELKQENWSQFDVFRRRLVLDSAGRELMHVYGTPGPPLLLEELPDKQERGNYSDDYYRTHINRTAELQSGELLGDNAQEALKTYIHEWRHSYQHQQVDMSNKPQFRNLVHNPDKAAQWATNFPAYQNPPPEELFHTDPELYRAKYQKYRHQPVEEDAHQFAEELVAKAYGT